MDDRVSFNCILDFNFKERGEVNVSKKNEKVAGKIQFICPNCDLDRTKEENPLRTHCPRCGFNPSFPNKIVTMFEDLLRALDSKQKSMDELKQKLQQLKHLFSCFIEHIPKHERDVNASYANFIWEIDKKFEELLKEEKEAKPK
jgi:hypothetical protein